MSGPLKVHLGRDGKSRCGYGQLTSTDRAAVTCQRCLAIEAGTYGQQAAPVGLHTLEWWQLQPCGTAAAYKRHLRKDGKPVRCPRCLEGERVRTSERERARTMPRVRNRQRRAA